MSVTYMDDPIMALPRKLRPITIDTDPVRWAKLVLNIETYSKQREILRLLEFVPKLAVPSCHDAGKSFIAALACVRFLARYPPGTARIVTTAPTMTQVRAILWNEINAMFSRVDSGVLPGRVNQTEWWIGGYMAGIGRKPSDYAPETFQGLHAEHILIVIDEAGGVPNEIWTGVDTLATNKGAVILAIGNPDDPLADFKDVVSNAPENGWTVVKIPAWETPGLSGEKVSQKLLDVLLNKDWVEDKRTKWGEDSALWASKIAAEFPDEASMTVVRLADVQAAIYGLEIRPPQFEQVQLGVDIAASETGDQTVIRERRGNRLLRRWCVQSGEPEDVSDLIVEAQMQSGATLLHIDATGVGFGFLSDIRRRIPGIAVMPFVAAAAAVDRVQFVNRRAEAHWHVRDKLRRRELDFFQMEDQAETVAQLTSIRYLIKKGKIQVEEKDIIRKRIGRSPDDSDALLLAVLPPSGSGAPAPATAHAQSSRRNHQRDLAAAQQLVEQQRATGSHRVPHHVPERVFPPSKAVRLPRRRIRSVRATTV
jgi:hypothetical protein